MKGDIKFKYIGTIIPVLQKVKNWPTYFLDLFGLLKKRIIIYKTWDGLKYFARSNTSDRGIITTVALQDEYEIKSLNLQGETIIDIGGQNGYFSVFASKYAKTIYTFEPTPQNFKIIKKNIEINKLKKIIHAQQAAVSDKTGKTKIFISEKNTGMHSMYGEGDNFIECETITLKSIFDKNNIEYCKLLKLDAEGAEYSILYTLPDKYFEKIEHVRMEVHDLDTKKNNHKELIKFLQSKKFKINYEHPILFAKK